ARRCASCEREIGGANKTARGSACSGSGGGRHIGLTEQLVLRDQTRPSRRGPSPTTWASAVRAYWQRGTSRSYATDAEYDHQSRRVVVARRLSWMPSLDTEPCHGPLIGGPLG